MCVGHDTTQRSAAERPYIRAVRIALAYLARLARLAAPAHTANATCSGQLTGERWRFQQTFDKTPSWSERTQQPPARFRFISSRILTHCDAEEVVAAGPIHLDVTGAHEVLVPRQRQVPLLARLELYESLAVAATLSRQAQADAAPRLEGARRLVSQVVAQVEH